MVATAQTEAKKPINRKVSYSTVGGGGFGAVVAWVWGMLMPDNPMPPEIAPIIGSMIGGVIGYFTRE